MSGFRLIVLFASFTVIAAAVFTACAGGKKPLPYLDTSLTFEQRAADLVSRMTLEEKISQMGHDAPAVERLGVPAYNWWNEALHGVARDGIATVFPQAIGMAATWDQEQMLRVATVISDEGRAKYHESVRHDDRRIYHGLTYWSPNINIFRDPRWGRGMETYGEDPYLTGRMGVQFVRGIQGDDPKYLKAVATAKHYAVHSGPEPDRHRFDARVSKRDLYETYLDAFHALMVEAGAWSIMGAYNRFEGDPCCASPTLLEEILRGDWGFQGYVVSDCWAIRDFYSGHNVVANAAEAAALAVERGCDLNCGDAYQDALLQAVADSLIDEATIDLAVRRLFTARMKLGMFDPDSLVPWAATPYSVNDTPEHRAVALETARKSIVLLKNDMGLLPLDKNHYKKVLVLGPQAVSINCLLGNYNGFPSEYATVLEGIRAKLPDDAELTYRTGCRIAGNFENFDFVPPHALTSPDGGNGLKAEYFATPDLSGEPVATGTANMLAYEYHGFPWPKIPELEGKSYSVRWSGKLAAPVDGTYGLRIMSRQKYSLLVDGQPAIHCDKNDEYSELSTELEFTAGSTHDILIELYEGEGDSRMMFAWRLPDQTDIGQQLKESDLVVLCLGLSPNLEGEEMPVQVPGFSGGDRVSIGLPQTQEELIAKAAASGKPVVLVLMNGSAVAVNQADSKLHALVEAWYPGEEGGRAVADVLFGDYNPAGRLPVTFYKSVEQLPAFENYDMQGRTYRYFGGDPLYPFGHGLSYTTFAYSGLELEHGGSAGDSVLVSVTVTNSGALAGEEVVQLYVSDLESSVPVPIRALAGFKRIALEPGAQQTVSFTISPKQLSVIDDNGQRKVEPGRFRVSVGGKQPGFNGSADAASTGTEGTEFELSGEPVQLPL